MPRSKIGQTLVALAAAACVTGPALAQQNIEKLKQMKVATTDLNIPVVPQEGKNAAAIRENLKRVKLPPGFRIALFALKISSTKAKSASGSFPVTTRANRSCSRALSEMAPKSSSGVENFVRSRSK